MKRSPRKGLYLLLAVVMLLGMAVVPTAFAAGPVQPDGPVAAAAVSSRTMAPNAAGLVYDAIPNPLPPNVVSVGFQATSTYEFGDYIHLGGTNRALRTVTVTMSDWALYSSFSSDSRYAGNAATWSHPITLNIYNVVAGDPNTAGSLLATKTQTFDIPWRPEGDLSCGTPAPGYSQAWKASDGNCYYGFAFKITFDLSSLNVTLPDAVLVAVAYNTNTHGANPIGQPGPYESLNVGVMKDTIVTVGTDDNAGRVFMYSTWAGAYDDGGSAGIFREASNCAPYGTMNFQITADAPCSTDCYVDAATGNDANLGSVDSPFKTIQKGVTAVAAGGTVHVANGTYVEQVVVAGKSLTIKGDSLAAEIEAPVSMTACFATSSSKFAVVCAKDSANLTVDTLTIDGAGRGNGKYQFTGVAFHNSSGAVKNSEITDVRDTPFSGTQHGVALYLYNEDTISRAFSVSNTKITGFQKNAMALNAKDDTPLALTVTGNTIVGAGPTAVTAQNGIQVMGKLTTGEVTENNISGIAYDNSAVTTKWVASSILDYYTSATISNNVITSAQTAIYKYDASGVISGNEITINKVGDSGVGIEAADPPSVIPSPFEESQAASAAEAATAPAATVSVDILNNTVLFSGSDNVDTVGIEAYAGYGSSDLDLKVDGNKVNGFDYGVGIWQCESGCTAGVFTDVDVNHNDLAGNTIGLHTNVTALTVDGTNNWWGAACGPAAGYVVGNVDYSPWWTDAAGVGTADSGAPGEIVIPAGASTATQNAVMACAAGKTVKYAGAPAAGGVEVTTNDVTIDLGGFEVGPGSPAFTINADNVVLQNGVLNGALHVNGATSPAVLVQAGADNFTLSKVEVKNWLDGVQVAGAVTSLKIVNNFIHNNTEAGLQVDGVVSGVQTVQGNLFKENGTAITSVAALDAQWNSFAAKGACPTLTNVTTDNCTFAETFIDVDPTDSGDTFTRNVDESNTFDVKVMVDAQNLYGFAFKFKYDDTKLVKNSAQAIVPTGYACLTLPGLATNEIGYQCAPSEASSAALNGLVAIGVANFTATGAGLTDDGPWEALFDVDHVASVAGTANGAMVYLNNVKLAGVTNDRDITETEPVANDGKIVIRGIANFRGFIDVQGRANDSGALLQVFETNALNTPVLANATSAAGGGYTTAHTTGNLLTVGTTYYFLVDKALYVKTAVGVNDVLSMRAYTDLSTLVLKGGDADNSEDIDVDDATCIGGAYGTTGGVCGTTGHSDVNGDGKVDILDLTLMGGNYGITASNWTP